MTTQARELAKLVNNSGDISLGDDITLGSDGALLNFGADSDVVITHVADTGLLLNSTRQLQFGDSGTYIHQSADGVLDLVSDTEIEINATTIDINGNADISGTLGVTGAITGNLTGTASLATASTITANNSTDETVFPVFVDGATGTQGLETDTGFTYNPSTNTLGVVNLTVSGTNTIVDSVTMNANNAVIFEGATANAHETTLTSIDATGDRTISLPNVSGTLPVLAVASATAITTTPEEINLIDGGTSRGTTAVADGDGILHNDAGTMLMTSAATFKTYFQNGVQATTSSGIAVSGTALTLKTTSSTANDRAGAGFNATESSTDSSRRATMYLDADNGAFGTGDSGAYFYIEKKGGGGEVDFVNQDNAALNFKQSGNLKFTMSGNNLHLNGGTDARIQLGTSGAGATSTSNDTVHIRGDGDSMKLMAAANGHYIFEENGTQHMRINSGGDIAIGNHSPSHDVHIKRDASETALCIQSNIGGTGSAYGGRLRLQLGAQSNSGSGNADTQAGDVLGQIMFEGQGTDYSYQGCNIKGLVQTGDGNDGRSNQAAGLIFETINVGSVSPAERMRISGNGRVGIGTDDPQQLFHVSGGSGASTVVQFGQAYDTYIKIKATNTASAMLNFMNASDTVKYSMGYRNDNNAGPFRIRAGATLDAGGHKWDFDAAGTFHVIPNNTGALLRLQSSGSGNDSELYFLTASNGRGIYVDDSDTNKMKFYTGYGKDANREFELNNSGDISIHPTRGFYFDDFGDTYMHEYSANELAIVTGNTRKFALSGGNLYHTGSINSNHNFSDERLKENIVVIPNALEKVNNLRGITFTRKDDGSVGTGLIAQELEKVLPEAVYDSKKIDSLENPDAEEYKAINYGNTVGLLVEAIKELEARVKNLEG